MDLTKKCLKTFGLTEIYAIAVNVIIALIAQKCIPGGAEFRELKLDTVIELTFAGVLAAGVVYLLIASQTKNARKIFKIVALIALIFSFGPDLFLLYSGEAGATTSTISVLMLLHIVTAMIVIYMFTKKRS